MVDFELVPDVPVIDILLENIPDLTSAPEYDRVDADLRDRPGLVLAAVSGMCNRLGFVPTDVIKALDRLSATGDPTVRKLLETEFLENLRLDWPQVLELQSRAEPGTSRLIAHWKANADMRFPGEP
jgi:hypothetical protein